MNEAFLFDYDHEKVMKKTENSIREESYGKGFNKGLIQGKEEGIVEGSRYNVPISMDI